MAIYKNREVTVIGPNPQASTPETVNIQYLDGNHENVSTGLVSFTEDEKKALTKRHPSKFDGVNTITDEDLKAVRVGVAPPSDPAIKLQAETQARHKKQQDAVNEQNKKAQDEANKKIDAQINAPAAKPVVQPQTQVKK